MKLDVQVALVVIDAKTLMVKKVIRKDFLIPDVVLTSHIQRATVSNPVALIPCLETDEWSDLAERACVALGLCQEGQWESKRLDSR